MTDIKKIEEGLKFLDSHLAATRRFHGIDTRQTMPKQPKRWWRRRRPDPPVPTVTDLYNRLYHRFESRLAGLCSELMPVFEIFVHNDGICINGESGEVGWLKIVHGQQGTNHTLTIHFAAHKVYTYTEHRFYNTAHTIEGELNLYNEPDTLLKLVVLWPEFQSGLHDWLNDLRETNRRKIDEANKALASPGA